VKAQADAADKFGFGLAMTVDSIEESLVVANLPIE
jgi:hypothetical protein